MMYGPIGLDRQRASRASIGLLLTAVAGVGLTTGCASVTPVPMRAQHYRIEVSLNPANHRITGRTVLDLTRVGDVPPLAEQAAAVEFLLHPSLKVRQIAVSGTSGRYGGSVASVTEDQTDPLAPRVHRVVLDEPVDALTLYVLYDGPLYQDASAGEVAGQIHNLGMRAHIGTDGIYLAGAHWYPTPRPAADEESPLASYTVIADRLDGYELSAGADRDEALELQTGRLAWRTPYPTDGMVLVGGAHEVHEATHGNVNISLHLKPEQSEYAAGLIQTVQRNLDRYEPLLGPYPARDFRIVDNFFSSGFAFPTFTLLSSAVIDMGERSQTAHGYIDHEMLHCWWGNGVHVDPTDGNWCEALASYGANYYGYVLDGKEDEARRKRRNFSHFLSRMKPERDKPLGTYGQDDGCGRGIAYQKGAAVFHMLAHKIGQENFWAAMRRFTAEHVGTYASWKTIQNVCEEVSGVSLDRFMKQWVRGSGAPSLGIERATYNSADQKLTVTLVQGEPAFELDVPLRISHATGHTDVTVAFATPRHDFLIPLADQPIRVEVDPDYHIFRKIAPEDIIPTTASTRTGVAFASVTPAGDFAGAYKSMKSSFESSFEQNERVEYLVGNIPPGALAKRCALILGNAVHDPYVAGFLIALEFPVRFTDFGFDFNGVSYNDPGNAVLCTVAHPDVKGGGVTIIFANSEAAIPSAMGIPMYDRSLVIFKDRKPVLRHDFERKRVVDVER